MAATRISSAPPGGAYESFAVLNRRGGSRTRPGPGGGIPAGCAQGCNPLSGGVGQRPGLSVGMAPAQQQPAPMVCCSILLVHLCSERSSSSSWTAARRGRVEVWPGPCGFGWHKPFGSHERCRADNAAAEGLLRRLRLYIHRTVWRRGVTPTLGRITLRDNVLPMIMGNAGEHEGIRIRERHEPYRCAATHIHATSRSSRSAWPQSHGWSGMTLRAIIPLRAKER